MENISSSSSLLTLKFKMKGTKEEGYITNSYGPTIPNLKRNFLDEINILGSSLIHQVWILGGEFNMITTPLEKQGGLRRINQESKAFGEHIEKLSLVDVPTRHGLFTWNNKREKEHRIIDSLERFLP
jgi:hypothetical protein